tara:strand:+ start:811 stop:1128 length:318 start_codon:yes stop_codon:yes gene_type:complete
MKKNSKLLKSIIYNRNYENWENEIKSKNFDDELETTIACIIWFDFLGDDYQKPTLYFQKMIDKKIEKYPEQKEIILALTRVGFPINEARKRVLSKKQIQMMEKNI